MELLLSFGAGLVVGGGAVWYLVMFFMDQTAQWQQVIGQQQERINQLRSELDFDLDIPAEER